MNAHAIAWADFSAFTGFLRTSRHRKVTHAFLCLEDFPGKACIKCRLMQCITIAFMDFKKVTNGDEVIVIPVPCSYRDCIELARSDYFRYVGRKASFMQLLSYAFCNHCFGFSFWLRMSAYRGWLYLFCRWMHRRYGRKFGLQIAPSVLIGYGLYIGHGFGTIVNPSAIIGSNVNLSQFTTVGSNEGRAAVIGNNVYIGPSVCLVENVHIGSNSCIGAGAVVVKDVPCDATVAGVPARVIGKNRHGNYVGHRWSCPVC